MNVKLLAVVVVAVLVVGGGAALIMSGVLDRDVDAEFNLVAQVNTEGSEIFVKEEHKEEVFYTTDADGNVTFNKEAWKGKLFLTPGPATIQHTMMKQIVSGMDLKFVSYEAGKPIPSNAVAFQAAPFNLDIWENSKADGGIIWQPVCQDIVQNAERKAVTMIATSQFAKDHACCVIAANHKYMSDNGDTVTAFLAAYIKSTEWVNDPANREELVELSKVKTGKKIPVIEAALDDVKYLNGDSDADNPLGTLKDNTSQLVTDLYAVGGILMKKLSDLGFTSDDPPADFAERFIQDEYLSAAMKNSDFKVEGKNIKVCVITGDIHQIALHVGIEKGFFKEHGVNVNVIEADNGIGVATSLQNGACDLGLLGLPPATITTINGSLITD